ncbi:MAG: hypothetical protein WEC37_00665 [Anaerolineales bacterium]
MKEVNVKKINVSNDAASSPPVLAFGTTVIGVPLLLTAVRCTLQYIVVPFVLPLLSISGPFSPVVNIIAGIVSLGVILYNLKRLWRTTWRNRYMLLSLFIIPFVLGSIYYDYLLYLSL